MRPWWRSTLRMRSHALLHYWIPITPYLFTTLYHFTAYYRRFVVHEKCHIGLRCLPSIWLEADAEQFAWGPLYSQVQGWHPVSFALHTKLCLADWTSVSRRWPGEENSLPVSSSHASGTAFSSPRSYWAKWLWLDNPQPRILRICFPRSNLRWRPSENRAIPKSNLLL